MKRWFFHFLTLALFVLLSTSFPGEIHAESLSPMHLGKYFLMAESVVPNQPASSLAKDRALEILKTQPKEEEEKEFSLSIDSSVIYGYDNPNSAKSVEGLRMNEIIFDIPGMKPIEVLPKKKFCIKQEVCSPVLDCKFNVATRKFNCEETPKCGTETVCYRQVP